MLLYFHTFLSFRVYSFKILGYFCAKGGINDQFNKSFREVQIASITGTVRANFTKSFEGHFEAHLRHIMHISQPDVILYRVFREKNYRILSPTHNTTVTHTHYTIYMHIGFLPLVRNPIQCSYTIYL